MEFEFYINDNHADKNIQYIDKNSIVSVKKQ